MEESYSSSEDIYPSKQRVVADIFYIFIVLCCLTCILGGVWSIFDYFMPTGKFEAFNALALGSRIAVIAGILAVLFILLIFFFGLYKKGRKWMVHFIFNVKEIEEKYKNRLYVKIVAGGLLISIIAILIGIIISLVEEIPSGNSPISAFLASFGTGNWILFAGVMGFAILAITLFLIYFWKNGYYLILRVMGKLEK